MGHIRRLRAKVAKRLVVVFMVLHPALERGLHLSAEVFVALVRDVRVLGLRPVLRMQAAASKGMMTLSRRTRSAARARRPVGVAA